MFCFSCNNNKTTLSNKVVQDCVGFFSKIERQKLSEKIIHFENKTANQICIYTIDSIPKGKTVLEEATRIANTLGVGTKEKNNGLIILISKNDNQIAIATVFGTEKVITNVLANTIIKHTIIPMFKQSLFYEGVDNGLDVVIENWK